MTAPQTTSASYEVGYRKPPRHTQFQKGQSGNPGGRPRRPARRLEELALYEAYRATIVMEDGRAVPMPAIQAVLRSQLQSAAGGNVRAQRDILAMIRDIEVVRSIFGPFESGGADDVVDDIDDADAIDGDNDDVDDPADADRDDAGGADDDEPARKQADGIDPLGERRQDIGARLRLDGATDSSPPPCGEGSGVGVERGGITVPLGTTPHPAPPPQGGRESARPNLTPMRRSRSPAVNARKIRQRHCGSSRRSPGRTNAGPGPAGGHARAPAAPAERDEKLKTRC
jgi:hypothetical protein